MASFPLNTNSVASSESENAAADANSGVGGPLCCLHSPTLPLPLLFRLLLLLTIYLSLPSPPPPPAPPLFFIERIYKFPPSPIFLKKSWKESSSAATLACGFSLLTSFADQIPTLMYAASIFYASYASCIRILIHYASADLSFSYFCDIYLSYSIHTLSALLFFPFSALSSPLFLL